MSSLGDRLKSVRRERRMSQAALAKAVGSRQSSINDIESGRNKTSTYLLKIANVLNVDPNWLETGVGEIRGVGVEIVNQGAALPLYDWIGVVDVALDESKERAVIDTLYRCPVKHSKDAYTISVEKNMDGFNAGSVLFIDPAGQYKNGDFVVVVFPESRMADLRMLVSDGMNTFIKSLDLSIDSSLRMAEVKLSCMSGGDLILPVSKKKDVPTAVLAGRLIFMGKRFL